MSSTSPSFQAALLAGGLAGTTVDLSLFPLDTLKTRLQAREGFFASGGFRGIYRGVGSAVVGSARHPLGTTDFSSYLLQGQASGAKVVAFASTGADLINAVKQAAEFGLTRTATLLALFAQISEVDALGLRAAQGLVTTEPFYWDMNEATRSWARRYGERMGGRMPTANQAGTYSSVLAYLRAARAAGSIEGARVLAALRAGVIDDPLFGPVTVRIDGRAVHAMHVFRVKAPAESRSRWDVYAHVATIPPEEAFRPLDRGGCPLVPK